MSKEKENYPFIITRKDKFTSGLRVYLLESTAPRIVEDEEPDLSESSRLVAANDTLGEFCEPRDSKIKQIIIQIHGYNSSKDVYDENLEENLKFFEKEGNFCKEDAILIFYRWPSETILSPLRTLFLAIPIPLILLAVLALSLILSTCLPIGLGMLPALEDISDISGKTLGTFIFSLIITLIILKLTVYFRDSYRANHYAVPDLTEFIREIDQRLGTKEPKIKLSFIAHSMGAFVATSAIRSLRDIFDENPRHIGKNFELSRLLLVAPDIPISSLLMLRSNFLSRSLYSCEEAYLFSNEGDMALRVASTVANSFVFPSKTRLYGYRLGNLSINGDECLHITNETRQEKDKKYGALKCKSTDLKNVFEIRDSFGNQYILKNGVPLNLNAYKEFLKKIADRVKGSDSVKGLKEVILEPQLQSSQPESPEKKIRLIQKEIRGFHTNQTPVEPGQYEPESRDIATQFTSILEEITEITAIIREKIKNIGSNKTEENGGITSSQPSLTHMEEVGEELVEVWKRLSSRLFSETPQPSKDSSIRFGEDTIRKVAEGFGRVERFALRAGDAQQSIPNNSSAENPEVKTLQRRNYSIDKMENSLKEIEKTFNKETSFMNIVNQFTFFDCTDYEDTLAVDSSQNNVTPKTQRLLSLELPNIRIKFLSLLKVFSYIILLPFWWFGWIDVHSGYFKGNFLKKHIYQLAFFGFQYFLPQEGNDATKIENLILEYEEKHIKVFLSEDFRGAIKKKIHPQVQEIEQAIAPVSNEDQMGDRSYS